MALEALFNQIVDAIHEKDGTTGGIAAEDFPDRIRAIPSGGGDFSGRLELPEPQDDEMYLLMHIPEGGSELLAFTVACTGEYTVELGTVRSGVFVPAESTAVKSGAKYETELFAADYGNVTSDGMAQAVVKISGTAVKTWAQSTHSRGGRLMGWAAVEIKCRLPEGTSVSCGNTLSRQALRRLRRFSWFGKNRVTNMFGAFQNCSSLTKIPTLDTSNVATMYSTFWNCSSLMEIPTLDTSRVTNMFGTFQSCSSLTKIPTLDTSRVTDMNYTFQGCSSLMEIPTLDTSRVTNMYSAFQNCISLASVKLHPDVSGWAGVDVSLSGCCLDHAALVELLESLPVITANHKLTLTGNPGVSELTEEEKAIASGKNWTLVL